MGLTESQRKWNERLEIEMKRLKEIDPFENISENIQEIYEKLRGNILRIDQKNIIIVEKKNYISFKIKNNNKNFVDIQLQNKLLKIVINVKFGKLNDPKNITRDISKLGHFGCGDYEIVIKSVADIENSLDLIRQSYNLNS